MDLSEEVKMEEENEKVPSIKTVTARCNKSCMECLSCNHKNPQAGLLLASLFNQGNFDRNKKWSDVEWLCWL